MSTPIKDGNLSTAQIKTTADGSNGLRTHNIIDSGSVDITSIAAGDNNIGNVDIASIAAGDNNIGNVDIASAIPAGSNNIGDVDIASITLPGTVATGQETVAATATQFNSGTSKVPVGVITVKALTANSGVTYIGPSGVTTSNGHALEAGDAVTLEIDDLNKLYHIGTASDVLTWMCNTA